MVRRALPFAFLLILAINLGSENAVAASQPAAGSESFVFADADCSGAVDSLDALLTLRAAAGLGDNGCSAVTDANCDAGRDAADTVEILRQGGGLGVTVAGCPPPGTSLAAVDPDPALVTAVLSDQLQVMQSVGPDGGQVIATGEDGTTYTLSVPAGALAVEESITLTPLASLGGFPLGGGMSGGVVIGPEDLLFTTPATVTISPSQAPAGEQLIGFGLRGDEFFFYPMLGAADPADLSAQGAPIRLPYIGPGGYGVGSGSTADIEAQQDRSPSQPEDQLARSLDEIFREHDHSSPEFDAALEIALRQYYLSGLIGGLQYAPDDCDVTRGLLVPFAKWLGLIQGFISNAAQPGDLFYDERSIMDNGLALGVANCFNETYERCRDNPNAEDAFLTMKYAGILQSGLVGNPDLDSLLGDWLDKINECTPQPCTVTDCRWVGSAHAEVYYFPSGNNQTSALPWRTSCSNTWRGRIPVHATRRMSWSVPGR